MISNNPGIPIKTTVITPNSSKPKFSRNMILAMSAIGLSLVAVILVVVFLISAMGSPTGQSKVTSTTTPTPTVSITVTPTSTAIPVNNGALLTLKMDAGAGGSGSLWNVDPRNYGRNQLSSQDIISDLLSWSPNNTYLAFGMKTDSGEMLSFWNNKNDSIQSTNYKIQKLSESFWSSSTQFVWIDYSNSYNPQIVLITLPDLSVKTMSIATTITAAKMDVSPDLNSVIFITPTQPKNPILLKRDIAKQYDLSSMNILPTGDFDFGLWLDNNNYIFYNNSGIYELNITLFTVNPIVNLHSNYGDPFNSTNMVLSADKNDLYFFYESVLHKFDFTTGLAPVIYDFNTSVAASDKISLAVTPNQRYVAVVVNNRTQLLEVLSGKFQWLCEDLCGEVVSQN